MHSTEPLQMFRNSLFCTCCCGTSEVGWGTLGSSAPFGRWELKFSLASALFEVSRGLLGANLITGGVQYLLRPLACQQAVKWKVSFLSVSEETACCHVAVFLNSYRAAPVTVPLFTSLLTVFVKGKTITSKTVIMCQISSGLCLFFAVSYFWTGLASLSVCMPSKAKSSDLADLTGSAHAGRNLYFGVKRGESPYHHLFFY